MQHKGILKKVTALDSLKNKNKKITCPVNQ